MRPQGHKQLFDNGLKNTQVISIHETFYFHLLSTENNDQNNKLAQIHAVYMHTIDRLGISEHWDRHHLSLFSFSSLCWRWQRCLWRRSLHLNSRKQESHRSVCGERVWKRRALLTVRHRSSACSWSKSKIPVPLWRDL